MDEGRPMRPLIVLEQEEPRVPIDKIRAQRKWRDLILGTHPSITADIDNVVFRDPLADKRGLSITDYERELEKYAGAIEYIDPYEHNEIYAAIFPEHIQKETSHLEIHPSTIMGLMTSQIPYANHNQSPRNQLSCSQSKQGVSVYSTNWKNRYDNNTHILCYGEAPLSRTMYWDYVAEGQMPYGSNIVLAIAAYTGYNQDDGIVMNADAIKRGLFRTICYRTYEIYEEDDEKAQTHIRIANPAMIPNWMDLRPGLDYSKLDERGIIRIGEYVDENTVMVGAYMLDDKTNSYKDSSLTPQVWTNGLVEDVVVTISPVGHRMIKVRVVQDRVPELGDKFCLTEDHDVLTSIGWVPITKVCDPNYKNIKVGQGVVVDGAMKIEYVAPTEYHTFTHSVDKVYQINMENTRETLVVTLDHRLWVKYYNETEYKFVKVKDIVLSKYPVMLSSDSIEYSIRSIRTLYTDTDDKVYCITVPSGIFIARKRGDIKGFYTGNSNRHGQKGTIGMLVRGHDMPRTEQGIVPDMLMNPHAIPSRMTIAQLLEQIGGKTAALGGSIVDGTAFMNEGSPADAYGSILEKQFGFERYGNEILYNGQTGEQMEAAIFIGPLYGMRLKHMVEDKWNARGQGRREQRTHQPTGGRGNQGGLKIGEQERDTIVCHGTSSFLCESITVRSDGARFPICTGCGTLPIYNARLGIAVCSLCEGPVTYVGNTANTLEMLPPVTKPRAEIVTVEMPYATKLFEQEINTFMNMGMRILTARGITRLKGTNTIIEGIATDTVELMDLKLQNFARPEEMALPEEKMMLVEDLERAEQRLEEMKTKIRDAEAAVSLVMEEIAPLQSQATQGEAAQLQGPQGQGSQGQELQEQASQEQAAQQEGPQELQPPQDFPIEIIPQNDRTIEPQNEGEYRTVGAPIELPPPVQTKRRLLTRRPPPIDAPVTSTGPVQVVKLE